jgi:DNA-binding NtrC family response regulator
MFQLERCVTTMPRGNGEHVLLVDDVSLVETEKQLIEQLGYRVTACTSSADALALLHATSERFNCVISNLAMARISGLELANTCRLCRPGTPFLLMSDSASVLSADCLRTLAISGFVSKPFSVHVLAETLHRVLAGRKI